MTAEEITSTFNDYLAEKVVNALNDRGFEAVYCKTREEAGRKALSYISEKSSVGWGGSVSIEECGLLPALRKGDYVLIDRDTAKSPEERADIMRKCLSADFFITGFNAVSQDGTVVNIDGNGNRVAAIAFGPKTVIAVVGINKITATEEEALARAKNTAAAKNAIRFGKSASEAPSLCNIVQILKNGGKGRIKVILTGDSLGF